MAGAIFLLLALGLALSFEFVNGFHDTANAVATVIYTHTLKPTYAVVWSGCWNLIGVLVSTGAVAFSVVSLLPVELVLNVGSGAGFAMVFALLISAIVWNLGTWYLGLPASSSHTLIGSIMGVGLANSLLAKGHVFGEGVNWAQAKGVGASLLISPIVGFVCAALLLLVSKALIKSPELYSAPAKDAPPPPWIRGLLILTCTGVSFAHGSNDGQKGMGLIMLILIGIIPGAYALNMSADHATLTQIVAAADAARPAFVTAAGGVLVPAGAANDTLSGFLKTSGKESPATFAALAAVDLSIADQLRQPQSFIDLSIEKRSALRTDAYLVSESITKLDKKKLLADPSIRAGASAQGAVGARHEVHPDVGQVRRRHCPWTRHHDRMEAHRGHGRREDRQRAPDLRAGRIGGGGGHADDRRGGLFRASGEYHARPLVRGRRRDGRQPFGSPDGHFAQPAPGVGPHVARVRPPRRDDVCGRTLPRAPCLRRAMTGAI